MFEEPRGNGPGRPLYTKLGIVPSPFRVGPAARFGQGIANPIAQVWAGAMMLEHLGRTEAAGEIVAAIEALLASTDAPKTPDLGGNARTADVAKALLTALPG